ncbi:acyl-homoserine-lactone synthase [Pleomorphomonas koreensis]|uniref:acyl-homoserine-lactone synthase n=1 Tax=Pleomorphomonas koreensis TaxID=257440 RepID=UPI00047BD0D7|nr:acyl-homoserine-lactone synthase [Pleomorphomonas koreensis]
MRAIAISPEHFRSQAAILDRMHQMRARVFHDRLNWDVKVRDGRERDELDLCQPTYILVVDTQEAVIGAVRLLPATGPTLLSVLFPELGEQGLFRPHASMIESSRFCVDTSIAAAHEPSSQALHSATWTLFAAIIEWSMANGYDELVTATDLRIERILRRAGWPMARIGEPKPIGNTKAVVGLLPTNGKSFETVRPAGYSSILQSTRRAA